MAFASYLFNHLIYRIAEFFKHWYINSFHTYTHFIISLLEKLDKKFAVKITWRHFREPLYQDRSIIGYILGFIFRSIRLTAGAAVYAVIIVLAAVFYLIWTLVPPFIVFKIISSIFIRI